ncbi:MAG: HPr family phosphocarrier protein [Alphaproteobacteria bacterium]|jgi:phosphocarrier protein HPr|nr:HPr family phosphocarrier protein [Thalassospira sp.]MCE2965720.1 HPr family phosphocarrier protein [Alphaproteobacteria bacterium]
MHSKDLIIVNERGLHARAAAKITRLASDYKADVNISYNGMTVPAGSLMGILMLGAAKGAKVTLMASGDDADAALASLSALIERKFDEE